MKDLPKSASRWLLVLAIVLVSVGSGWAVPAELPAAEVPEPLQGRKSYTNAASRDADTRAGANNAQANDPSRDPSTAPNAGCVYKVHIRTEDAHFVVDGETRLVVTGITVQADITTDRRRVIDFFLSPVATHLDEGMKVR